MKKSAKDITARIEDRAVIQFEDRMLSVWNKTEPSFMQTLWISNPETVWRVCVCVCECLVNVSVSDTSLGSDYQWSEKIWTALWNPESTLNINFRVQIQAKYLLELQYKNEAVFYG